MPSSFRTSRCRAAWISRRAAASAGLARIEQLAIVAHRELEPALDRLVGQRHGERRGARRLVGHPAKLRIDQPRRAEHAAQVAQFRPARAPLPRSGAARARGRGRAPARPPACRPGGRARPPRRPAPVRPGSSRDPRWAAAPRTRAAPSGPAAKPGHRSSTSPNSRSASAGVDRRPGQARRGARRLTGWAPRRLLAAPRVAHPRLQLLAHDLVDHLAVGPALERPASPAPSPCRCRRLRPR